MKSYYKIPEYENKKNIKGCYYRFSSEDGKKRCLQNNKQVTNNIKHSEHLVIKKYTNQIIY